MIFFKYRSFHPAEKVRLSKFFFKKNLLFVFYNILTKKNQSYLAGDSGPYLSIISKAQKDQKFKVSLCYTEIISKKIEVNTF